MDYFLTIAASDNSGGAGIQQDIKAAHDLGFWALSAVTGITVQDFKNAYSVDAVNPVILKSQIEQCFLSFPVKAVKIGAVCSKENLNVITECLQKYTHEHVVLDPVLFSSGGTPFFDIASLDSYYLLFPYTEVITPNKVELEILTGSKISSIDEGIEIAERKSKEWNTSILLKGGHFEEPRIKEALITQTEVYRFQRDRRNFSYSHGTGCVLSTAIACYSVKGKSLNKACKLASEYVADYFADLQCRL